jgi:hypothetical protein
MEVARNEVIGGPDAFVEPVKNLGDYAGAIRRKLLREIGAPAYSTLPGPARQASLEGRVVAASPAGDLE